MPRARRDITLNVPEQTKRRFAEEYLLDCDPWAAAVRCGLSAEYGCPLLARSDVQTKVRTARNRAQSTSEIYADAVLKRWYQLATADARELVGIHRTNCRHCHGHDHRYQFTVDELRRAREDYEVKQRDILTLRRVTFEDLPEFWGGDGFDPWADPDPDCTECGGKGVSQVWVADTRHLSPSAALLFDGVEVSRDGMRVKMRDRGWADQMVAAQLGIAVRGNTREPVPLDPARMSDEQLALAVESFRRAGLIENDDEQAETAGA